MVATLDEIRKALDAASAPLHAEQEPWPGNANLQYWVGDQYDGIGAFVKYEDAFLAANAPVWLRSLLEENGLLRIAVEKELHASKVLRREVDRLREELEQVKKERSSFPVMDNARINRIIERLVDIAAFADTEECNFPPFECNDEQQSALDEWWNAFMDALKQHVRGTFDDEIEGVNA